MSTARPAARRLVSWCRAPAPASAPSRAAAAPPSCRSFHSSAQLAARRRSRFKNVRIAEMGLKSEADIQTFTKKHFQGYTREEMEQLKKVYSPEQIAALEAGEAAINPRDLTIQGRIRVDPYTMPYIDDFRDIQPIVDKRPKNNPPPDSNARFMTMDEFTDDFIKWAGESADKQRNMKPVKSLNDFIPEGYKDLPEAEWTPEARQVATREYAKYLEAQETSEGEQLADDPLFSYMMERSIMTDNNLQSNSMLAPALPNKVPDVAGRYINAVDPADEGRDDTGVYKDLKKRTGLSVQQIFDLKVKVLVTRFVTNQTRLGKIISMSVLAVAGNQNGWLGLGMAKSSEGAAAMEKAKQNAIRNMQPIPRYENRTIYGNVEAKVGGTVVKLYTRPPGFGLRVSHRIFEMARAAGIHDLAGKMPRARNPMNSVKACYKALMSQRNPEEIAMGRGKKLVDVRKVYYGGNVL